MAQKQLRQAAQGAKPMSAEAKIKLAIYFALGVGLLVPFQNCAPTSSSAPALATSPSEQAASSSAVGANSSSSGLPVSTIDNVNATTALVFVESSATGSASGPALSLNGICSQQQNGATLRWTLSDPASGEEIATDVMPCDQGSFSVEIAPAQLPQCGYAYSVKAVLGMGQPASATVSKACGA
jgi:hypothetical protein